MTIKIKGFTLIFFNRLCILNKELKILLVFFVQNFIDLAGSERASQTLSAGSRLKEGCHINRSLLTLGTVIRKLRLLLCSFPFPFPFPFWLFQSKYWVAAINVIYWDRDMISTLIHSIVASSYNYILYKSWYLIGRNTKTSGMLGHELVSFE